MNNSIQFNHGEIIKGKITENITEDVSINYEEFHRYHHKIDDFETVIRFAYDER
jgi:hypothetical protein